MMTLILTGLIQTSLKASVMIAFACLIEPILEKRYQAKWRHYFWLGIALFLLIPMPITIENAPVQIRSSIFVTDVTAQPQMEESGSQEISKSGEFSSVKGENSQWTTKEWASVIWIAVGALYILYQIGGYLVFARRIRRWKVLPIESEWNRFDEIKLQLEIKRSVELYRCGAVKSPFAMGLIRPVVIIPLRAYSQLELDLILRHELLHIKQKDIFSKGLLVLVRGLHWFNPLVHVMALKWNRVMEMRTDEAVIMNQDFDRSKDYMDILIQEIQPGKACHHPLTTHYSGGFKTMKMRFDHLIKLSGKKTGSAVMLSLLIFCVGISTLVACTAKEPIAKPVAEVPSSPVVAKTGLPTPSEKISGLLSETTKDPMLEETIISTLEIPDDYLAQTRYYYNRVDLNGDGQEEIFAVILGLYTSGSGGSTAMILVPSPEGYNVNQVMTLIQTPVIISDQVTNGCKEIVVLRSGGGADGKYVALTCSDGYYQSVNDGRVLETLENVSGVAIINDDLVKDVEEGTALTLEK